MLPSSCHPPHCTENIPYSLALRIIRICTDKDERDFRLKELMDMLLSRNYPKKLVQNNIDKALSVPRSEALKRVVRKNDADRVVFPVTYHPGLPSIPQIISKHHRTMINRDQKLKEVFKKPPINGGVQKATKHKK